MTPDIFESIVNTQVKHCTDLLLSKGQEYAPGVDRLAAFKKAAGLLDQTQAQAAFGMLAKHLVSVADMVQSGEHYSPERWDEKIGDSINYLLIIRAIIIEEDAYNAPY